MKILHIITKSELGGAQSVVANLVNALCKDHEVTVIAGEGDGKMFDAINDRVQKIHCPYLKRAISPYNDIRTLYLLWKTNLKLKPDIIHLHSSKAGLLGRLILPKKKIIYTVHGFDSIRIAHRWLLPLERKMQHRCSTIVGVSQYDVNNLNSESIFQHTHLVYNGVSIPEEKKQFTIPPTYKKVVMCIARVAKPKRHDIFIDCAQQLPDYAFVWIGNQHPVEHVPENVFFMGNRPNASAYCHQADLFMLPSDYEGLPMVLLEAMCQGKPIVASRVGGIPEVVIDGENGYTIPNDSALFVEKIVQILENDDISCRFSKHSQHIYSTRFNTMKMVESYLKLYHKMTL